MDDESVKPGQLRQASSAQALEHPHGVYLVLRKATMHEIARKWGWNFPNGPSAWATFCNGEMVIVDDHCLVNYTDLV